MLVKFTSQQVQKCSKFAQEIDTGYYAKRNQFNNEKRIKDNLIGKLGEIATYLYFFKKEIKLSEPDFEIYHKTRKSWDYDMKNQSMNLHVKSQAIYQSQKYGESWIVENTDKHVFKEYTDKNSAEIKAIISLNDLHEKKMFKLPKLSYLTTKSAIYYADIAEVFKEQLFAK